MKTKVNHTIKLSNKRNIENCCKIDLIYLFVYIQYKSYIKGYFPSYYYSKSIYSQKLTLSQRLRYNDYIFFKFFKYISFVQDILYDFK